MRGITLYPWMIALAGIPPTIHPSMAVDRHRPGYFRDYHARNLEKRRRYLRQKARQYRRAQREAACLSGR